MHNNLPVWGEYDVVVLGGGPAGFSAAVASAENGANTLLVEWNGFLGGMATSALVMPWNVWAKPITSKDIGGVYKRLVDILNKDNSTFLFSGKTVLRSFDSSMVKIRMDQVVNSAGVKLCFHTLACDVLKEGNQITAVVLQNKSGRGLIKGKYFIDTTGDGDVAVRSGADYSIGNNKDSTQPATLIFKMGNVDIPTLINYLKNNPKELGVWPPSDKIRFGDQKHICVSGLFSLIKKGKEEGFPIEGNQLIITSTPISDIVTINITKVHGIDIENPFSVSQAEISAREQVLMTQKFLKKYIPGFENSYLAEIGIQLGIRETRRIIGDTIISYEDIQAGRQYKDRVGKLFNVGHLDFTKKDAFGNKITKFEYLTKELEIPFRSLLVKNIENLLTGGRCISTDSKAFGFIRTQTACFATGQAAGVIASIASLEKENIRNINISKVQETLSKQGIEL